MIERKRDREKEIEEAVKKRGANERELREARVASTRNARQRDRISNEPIKDGAIERERDREREKEKKRCIEKESTSRVKLLRPLSFDLPSLEYTLPPARLFAFFPEFPRA